MRRKHLVWNEGFWSIFWRSLQERNAMRVVEKWGFHGFELCICCSLIFLIDLRKEWDSFQINFTHWIVIFSFYLFQRKGKGGRKKGREALMWERNIDWLPLVHALTENRTSNPGMCPDWEWNWPPFSLQDNSQPTEPHWPGLNCIFEWDSSQRLNPMCIGGWRTQN